MRQIIIIIVTVCWKRLYVCRVLLCPVVSLQCLEVSHLILTSHSNLEQTCLERGGRERERERERERGRERERERGRERERERERGRKREDNTVINSATSACMIHVYTYIVHLALCTCIYMYMCFANLFSAIC